MNWDPCLLYRRSGHIERPENPTTTTTWVVSKAQRLTNLSEKLQFSEVSDDG